MENPYVILGILLVIGAIAIVSRGKPRQEREERTKNHTPEAGYVFAGGTAIATYAIPQEEQPAGWTEVPYLDVANGFTVAARYAVVSGGVVKNIVKTTAPLSSIPAGWVETKRDGRDGQGWVGSTYDPSTGFDDSTRYL